MSNRTSTDDAARLRAIIERSTPPIALDEVRPSDGDEAREAGTWTTDLRRAQVPGSPASASARTRLVAAAAAIALLAALAVPVSRWLRTSPDDDGTVRAGTPEQATSTTIVDPQKIPGDPAAMSGASWTDVGSIDGINGVELFDLPSGLWALGMDSSDPRSTRTSARVLRSDDGGTTWTDVGGDAFDLPTEQSVSVSGIAERAGVIAVVGARRHPQNTPQARLEALLEAQESGTEPVELPEPSEPRSVVWRSSDGGATWDVAEQRDGPGLWYGSLSVLTVDDGFVTVDAKSVWRSSDATSWDLVARFEDDMTINAATTFGDRLVVVGHEDDSDSPLESVPLAMWSDDGGRTWERATIDSDLEPTQALALRSVAAGPEGLLAVGLRGINTAFSDPHDDVGVWFSADGRSWSEREPLGDPDTADLEESVTWGRGGFLVEYLSPGRATKPLEAVTTATLDGSTWVPVEREEHRDITSVVATAEGYAAVRRDLPVSTVPQFTVTRIDVTTTTEPEITSTTARSTTTVEPRVFTTTAPRSESARSWEHLASVSIGSGVMAVTDLVTGPTGTWAVGFMFDVGETGGYVGAVWRVTDGGATWERVDGGVVSDLRLERIEDLDGRLVVAGDRATACPDSGEPGCLVPVAAWSDDGGASWNESVLPFEPDVEDRGNLKHIADMEATDIGLILVGRRPIERSGFGPQLWRSADGASWQELPTDQFGPGSQLAAAGTVGGDLVVTGTVNSMTKAAWRSGDGGTTWGRDDTLPPGPVSPNVGSGPIDLGALDDAGRTQWGSNVIPTPHGWLLSWISVDAGTSTSVEAGRAATSEDGVVWSPLELPEGRAVGVAAYVDDAYLITTFPEDAMPNANADQTTAEVYRLPGP
ncbi:MAG: hypothetical protein S0880_01855 [Actinomycetota bacterium]|nr:hypothetical protein [Actinomycetota bacterium]